MSELLVNRLKAIIIEDMKVNLKVEEIDENVPLFEGGLGIEPIAIVELITLIETKFGFEFSDSDINPKFFTNLKVLGHLISRRTEII